MVAITEENQILGKGSKILKLLIRFFDTDMTKEELRQEYIELLKDWRQEVS